jgi:hypothetical protein
MDAKTIAAIHGSKVTTLTGQIQAKTKSFKTRASSKTRSNNQY